MVRGFLARQRYREMLSDGEKGSKYFKRRESLETCRAVLLKKELSYAVKTYSTGACYSGQMLGEALRHGTGCMVWTDTAQYQGDWDYNQASGKGKFKHADGDTYEGEWFNNKANGKGIYLNAKGAKYTGTWKDDQ